MISVSDHRGLAGVKVLANGHSNLRKVKEERVKKNHIVGQSIFSSNLGKKFIEIQSLLTSSSTIGVTVV